MADSTIPFDSWLRPGNFSQFPVLEAVHICPGVIVALDAAGKLLPGRDTAGLVVVGRATQEADNRLGATGDLNCLVESGIFSFTNSATNPFTAADVGKMAFVEDDITVALTSTNKCKAGRMVGMGDDGTNTVWVDMRKIAGATVAATDATTDGLFTTQAAAATAAADNAALKIVVNAMAVELEKATDFLRAAKVALQAAGILK